MQLFLLSLCPKQACAEMADTHIISSCKELMQIISTAWACIDPQGYQNAYDNKMLCKKWPTWKHPSIKWTMASVENYWFVVSFLIACLEEFEFRRKQKHAYHKFIDILVNKLGQPANLPEIDFVPMTQMYQAIPTPQIKHINPVIAYRRFYIIQKSFFVTWKWGRDPPEWFTQRNEYLGFEWLIQNK